MCVLSIKVPIRKKKSLETYRMHLVCKVQSMGQIDLPKIYQYWIKMQETIQEFALRHQ